MKIAILSLLVCSQLLFAHDHKKFGHSRHHRDKDVKIIVVNDDGHGHNYHKKKKMGYKNEILREDNRTLKKKNRHLRQKNKHLKNENYELVESNRALMKKIRRLERSIHKLEKEVAFHDHKHKKEYRKKKFKTTLYASINK